MVRTLTQVDENTYELSSKAKSMLGSIREKSVFQKQHKKYIANDYFYSRSILRNKSERRIEFNWETLTGTYTRLDKPSKNGSFSLKEDILDPSLYQLKVQDALYNGSKSVHLSYARDSRVKNMSLSVKSKSEFKMGKKRYKSLTLTRDNTEGKKQTEIIVIPEFGYQIASIKHTNDSGDTHSTKLHAFKADYQRLKNFYTKSP